MNKSNTAWVCAGQGAQAVGMGRDLAEKYPACRKIFDRASKTLGFDLANICFSGPETELTKSNICQPAIFTVSTACAAALCTKLPRETPRLVAMAGLSLGEWTALHLAGAVEFDDCVRILEARGRFMQDACEATQGGMLSVIGLDADRVTEIAAETGVVAANFNSPQQTVLSGSQAGIEKAEPAVKSAGAKRVVRLNVAGAFHSELMQPAAEKLAQLLEHIPIQTPEIPVISNVTGKPHGGPDAIRELMVRQVTSAVRWVDCVRALEQAGTQEYIELGPGRVLSGLIKRILTDPTLSNVQDLPSLEKTTAQN